MSINDSHHGNWIACALPETLGMKNLAGLQAFRSGQCLRSGPSYLDAATHISAPAKGFEQERVA